MILEEEDAAAGTGDSGVLPAGVTGDQRFGQALWPTLGGHAGLPAVSSVFPNAYNSRGLRAGAVAAWRCCATTLRITRRRQCRRPSLPKEAAFCRLCAEFGKRFEGNTASTDDFRR